MYYQVWKGRSSTGSSLLVTRPFLIPSIVTRYSFLPSLSVQVGSTLDPKENDARPPLGVSVRAAELGMDGNGKEGVGLGKVVEVCIFFVPRQSVGCLVFRSFAPVPEAALEGLSVLPQGLAS